MTSNDDLEKRIENLEKEVKHLKAAFSIKQKIRRDQLIVDLS